MKAATTFLLILTLCSIVYADSSTKYPLNDYNYPVWIDNSFYNDFIGSVGMATQKEGDSAKNPDQSVIYMQRQIAKLKALRAIHRWLDVNVDFYSYGMLKDRVRFKSYAHHSASDLENTEIEDEWLDEKTGDLYIWLVISKKNSLR